MILLTKAEADQHEAPHKAGVRVIVQVRVSVRVGFEVGFGEGVGVGVRVRARVRDMWPVDGRLTAMRMACVHRFPSSRVRVGSLSWPWPWSWSWFRVRVRVRVRVADAVQVAVEVIVQSHLPLRSRVRTGHGCEGVETLSWPWSWVRRGDLSWLSTRFPEALPCTLGV